MRKVVVLANKIHFFNKMQPATASTGSSSTFAFNGGSRGFFSFVIWNQTHNFLAAIYQC